MKITSFELDEALRNALARNDVQWLKTHKDFFDVNHRFVANDNETLLSYSISDTGSDAYIYLLREGADVFLVNAEGESIFHSAVFSGLSERIDVLLKFHPEAIKLLNSQSNDGTSPLLLAVLLEKLSVCRHLLELGADVNLMDHENNAPIHPACHIGNMDIVELLMEHGADLRIKTAKGNYPLALAINEDHDDVTKYLLTFATSWRSDSKKN